MALRSNGNMACSVGVQHFGASAYLSAIPSALQSNFAHTNKMRNLTAGEGITSELVGLPSGGRHPAAWMMPQKAGALAARNTVVGTGTSAATGQSGYNIDGTISGAGDIPNSVSIGLIVSIAAALTASGGISSAATQALASLVAGLTGSGSVTATAAGLAELGALLSSAGFVTANNTALMDIASTIRGYGDLTPEGIRDQVWNALAANFNAPDTMGQKLNNAASGGVDYNALAAAVWAYAVRTLTTSTAGMFSTPLVYKANNNTAAADPGTGKLRWNNATQASASELYFDAITDTGIDITNYLATIPAGSTIFVQDKDDAAKYQKWQIASLTDNAGWVTASVSLLASGGTNIANNQQVVMVFNNLVAVSNAPSAADNAGAVWGQVIEAGFSADELLRLLAAHAAGAATGLENGNPQFTGLDGSTLRIDGTYAAGTRTIDALNGT